VLLRSADYVGRPVDDVEAELVGLGLRVDRHAEQTGAAAPGTVLDVGPVGSVSPGQVVTVTYAVAPDVPAPSSPAPSSASVEPATGGAAPAAPAPQPAGVVETATSGADSDSTGPGDGNGHDKPKPAKPDSKGNDK
jgi:serine/threonine-protein kinase